MGLWFMQVSWLEPLNLISSYPVSYTHLDVYKRQVIASYIRRVIISAKQVFGKICVIVNYVERKIRGFRLCGAAVILVGGKYI